MALHFGLSIASSCQVFVSTPAFRNALYSERPYVNWGAPLGLFDRTHDDIIFLGSLSQGILITCPAQRSCCLQMEQSIDFKDSLFKSMAFDIRCSLVCFLLTRHIALRQRWWKFLSFLRRVSVKLQDSAPYKRIDRINVQ